MSRRPKSYEIRAFYKWNPLKSVSNFEIVMSRRPKSSEIIKKTFS